jgi:hypothetical protein
MKTTLLLIILSFCGFLSFSQTQSKRELYVKNQIREIHRFKYSDEQDKRPTTTTISYLNDSGRVVRELTIFPDSSKKNNDSSITIYEYDKSQQHRVKIINSGKGFSDTTYVYWPWQDTIGSYKYFVKEIHTKEGSVETTEYSQGNLLVFGSKMQKRGNNRYHNKNYTSKGIYGRTKEQFDSYQNILQSTSYSYHSRRMKHLLIKRRSKTRYKNIYDDKHLLVKTTIIQRNFNTGITTTSHIKYTYR